MVVYITWNIVTTGKVVRHRKHLVNHRMWQDFQERVFFYSRNVTDANLRFLTPEQALADTAHFVNFIRTSVSGAANSPIILVGGHYSASLAIWFRQRYPHLSAGKMKVSSHKC